MKELKKILYTDDEPDVETVVEITVQTICDYDIKICPSGKELVECVEEYSPDLILINIMMPEMEGQETFQNLKNNEKTKDIPIIFITTKTQINEFEIFKDLGVIGLITKPFDPIKLCSDIDRIWKDKYNQ